MFDFKVRTNNQAEGYNYALGSKILISKPPNPHTYILDRVLKNELNITSENAIEICILLIFLITFIQKYVRCVYLCQKGRVQKMYTQKNNF